VRAAVPAAAERSGWKAVGVAADGELVELSGDRAREVGVGKLGSFEHADLFEADFSAATVAAS
jgi:hypothetical protein